MVDLPPNKTYKNKLQWRHLLLAHQINEIHHRSPMQTEKSQPEGKRMMPETRFTEFPALSVDPRAGISLYASELDD